MTIKHGHLVRDDKMSHNKVVSVSNFKAHCLDYLTKMNNQNSDIIITKRGKPFARIQPIKKANSDFVFGKMKGIITINGDLLEPIDIDWEENL